jgi:branched-chain amino acid transport system permease protein
VVFARHRGRRRAVAVSALLVVVSVALLLRGSENDIYIADAALLAAIGAVGLNLVTGYSGQVSIGTAAFLAIGGYTVVMTSTWLPFPLTIVAGMAAAAIAGFVIGVPSLRLTGLYLIFSTLALQYVVSFAYNQFDSSTGAVAGHFVKPPSIGGWKIESVGEWFIVLIIVLLAVIFFVANLANGRPGRALHAVRTNEAAATVMGIEVTGMKIAAFVYSSAIIGLGGGIGAYFLQVVNYEYYSLTLAVSYIAMILIGGLGSLGGSVVGAAIVSTIPFVLQRLSTWLNDVHSVGLLQRHQAELNAITYGLMVLLFIYVCPGGIAGLWKRRASAGTAPGMNVEPVCAEGDRREVKSA